MPIVRIQFNLSLEKLTMGPVVVNPFNLCGVSAELSKEKTKNLIHTNLLKRVFLSCAQIVRKTVEQVALAVKGEIVMSLELDKVSLRVCPAAKQHPTLIHSDTEEMHIGMELATGRGIPEELILPHAKGGKYRLSSALCMYLLKATRLLRSLLCDCYAPFRLTVLLVRCIAKS